MTVAPNHPPSLHVIRAQGLELRAFSYIEAKELAGLAMRAFGSKEGTSDGTPRWVSCQPTFACEALHDEGVQSILPQQTGLMQEH